MRVTTKKSAPVRVHLTGSVGIPPRCVYMKQILTAGLTFSNGFFYYFLRGLSELYRPRKLAAIPGNLPVLLIAGGDDPVGSYGKNVIRLEELYKGLGMTDVKCKLYPGARHELLNEINRDEVMADVLAWMEQRLGCKIC